MDIKFQVGGRSRLGKGTENIGRSGSEGQIITADAHGRYHEAAVGGYVYAVTTAPAGTTVVAGNVSPPAAAAATILSLHNPLNSQVLLSILRVRIASLSGTPGAGGFSYCLARNADVTASQNAPPSSSLASSATGSGRGFTQTALTGGTLHALYRLAGPMTFAAALAASAGPLAVDEEVAGEIVLPAGGIFSIAAGAVGTTWIVSASIVYEEIEA